MFCPYPCVFCLRLVSERLCRLESICKKAATRLYFLKQLKRAKVPPNDMLLFLIIIYMKKLLDSDWLRKECKNV